nr:MAG TPA: hypothetical protein [Caudoviricetes sp.]
MLPAPEPPSLNTIQVPRTQYNNQTQIYCTTFS